MKTLDLECNMGAAGDMLMAALFDLIEEKDEFLNKMNNLGLPGVRVTADTVEQSGIVGRKIRVIISGAEEGADNEHHHNDINVHIHEHTHDHENINEHSHEHSHMHSNDHIHDSNINSPVHSHKYEHHHSHMHMSDIETLVNKMPVSDNVKQNILKVYNIIAEAESKAHGKPVQQIHFHEVGQLDAVADITGVCILMDILEAEKIIASDINVGSGFVKCAHGMMPVPAPATAEILKDIPIYSNNIEGELCTPTGAALLKVFVSEYGQIPSMITENTGYGMGTKQIQGRVNCVRAFIGRSSEKSDVKNTQQIFDYNINEKSTPVICKLECNIDDMTAEGLSFAKELLMEAGALDVYTIPINMKKNRDGVMLCCLCEPDDEKKIAELIFRHTSTIGIRTELCRRYLLEREIIEMNTEYGKIRMKVAHGASGKKYKPEYDDVAAAAEKYNKTFKEISMKVIEDAERADL